MVRNLFKKSPPPPKKRWGRIAALAALVGLVIVGKAVRKSAEAPADETTDSTS